MTKNFRSLKPGDCAVFTAPNGDTLSVSVMTVMTVKPESVCVTWMTAPNTFKATWVSGDIDAVLVPFGAAKFLAV
jgi:hypothetical protein